jgi:hypothetical protein
MSVTIFGAFAILVFGAVGYFRGVFRVLAAFAALLLAAPLSGPLAALVARPLAQAQVIPRALAPLAAQALAGLVLFGIVALGAGLLIRRLEARREERGRACAALWEQLSGAVLGAAWGFCVVSLCVAGLHLAGQVEAALAPPVAAGQGLPQPEGQKPAALGRFSALQEPIERSAFAFVVRKTAPAGGRLAGTLQDLTAVVSSPALLSDFKQHPGLAGLAADPRLQDLSQDRQIRQLLQNKQYRALLDNEKVAALVGDKRLARELRNVPLGEILKEVLGEAPAPAEGGQPAPAATVAEPPSAAACGKCIGANGKGKEAFPSEREAAQQAALLQRASGQTLYTYACPFKNGWHLTKTRNGP